jgi:biopolymer transport protein ExbB
MKKITTMMVLVLAVLITGQVQAAEGGWWDKAWSGRKAFTVETESVGMKEAVGTTVVLVRLHQGNFPFASVKEDGSDLRFVGGADGKSPLKFHIEKWDPLLYEGYVWVQVPEVGNQSKFWVYYGNPQAGADEGAADVKGTYGEGTVLVYHLGERGTPPKDASAAGNDATSAGVISEGALIGSGVRLLGGEPIGVPASESLKWTLGQEFTFSAWIKSGASAADAVVFSRSENGSAFRVGLDQGVPYVEITSPAGGTQRSGPIEALPENAWRKLTVVGKADRTTLYVDGVEAAAIEAGVPGLESGLFLGGDDPAAGTSNGRFVGEVDEVNLVTRALPAPAIAFAALNQSASEKATQLLVAGVDESSGGGGGHNEALEHVMLFGDIAKNMMFDGWIAIGVCVLMILTGWTVAAQKYLLLSRIQKGTDEFLKQWKHVSSDLTVLDSEDDEKVKSFGGNASGKSLKLMRDTPLFHVYHIGAEEIRHRMVKGKMRGQGLSSRSMQAIKAALEAGLVRENQRLNKGIVFLTISIAGGPYVGLLGTVVGVMITFAIIAKSGEVDVNSIAPGIASALLATVAGLIVAIPALFIYSYLSSRIRDVISEMQVFIDEFVAKIAEFYPPPSEVPVPAVKVSEQAQERGEPKPV